MIDFDKLCHLIENGIFNNEDRELLAQTLRLWRSRNGYN